MIFLLLSLILKVNAQDKSKLDLFLPWNTSNDSVLRQDSLMLNSLSNDKVSFQSGLVYKASHSERMFFGGISAITFVDLNRLIAFSDYSSKSEFQDSLKAKWFNIDLEFDNSSLSSASILENGQVTDELSKLLTEIEGVARLNKKIYLTLDESKKIFVYNDLEDNIELTKPHRTLSIPMVEPINSNYGFEALTFTKSELLLTIYEKRMNGGHRAWMINPISGSSREFLIKSKLDDIKGASTLRNGDIILIEKTFDKNTKITKLRMSLIPAIDLNLDEINPIELLMISSTSLDNFEGITTFSNKNKENILLVSDDNGDRSNPQRTLLLHFIMK